MVSEQFIYGRTFVILLGLSEHARRKMRVNDSYAPWSSEDVTLLLTNTNPPLNVLIVVSDKIGFEFSLIPQPRCALD